VIKIRSYFRDHSNWWHPFRKLDKREWIYKREYDQIFKILSSARKLGLALDLGTGEGRYAFLLHRREYYVIAIDINLNFLRNISKNKFQIELIQADAVNIPIREKCFDIILAIELFPHIPQIKKCLSEINRILKPGSKAIISITNKLCLYTLWVTKINPILKAKQREYFRKQYTRSEFTYLLKETGFDILSIYGYGVVSPISLLPNWRLTIVPASFSKILSSILDPIIGQYIGHILIFVVRRRRLK
jgi:SAM-dependent methyltransferase